MSMCWTFKYIEDAVVFYVFACVTCFGVNIFLSVLLMPFFKKAMLWNKDFAKLPPLNCLLKRHLVSWWGSYLKAWHSAFWSKLITCTYKAGNQECFQYTGVLVSCFCMVLLGGVLLMEILFGSRISRIHFTDVLCVLDATQWNFCFPFCFLKTVTSTRLL